MTHGDKATNLVWMDLEMTGLDIDNDAIIEIATIITDKDLNVLAEGPVIAIQCPEEKLSAMSDFVREMHTKNGLLERVKASTVTLEEAQAQTLAFIKEYTEEGKNPLCGNSIATDKMFLIKQMPSIAQHLHYRLLDVSTLKILNTNWQLGPLYEKESTHLALDDIRESIKELAYYRKQLFNL